MIQWRTSFEAALDIAKTEYNNKYIYAYMTDEEEADRRKSLSSHFPSCVLIQKNQKPIRFDNPTPMDIEDRISAIAQKSHRETPSLCIRYTSNIRSGFDESENEYVLTCTDSEDYLDGTRSDVILHFRLHEQIEIVP